jgi:NADH:ubiquinone oxidoreductase subunit F (NADH-binding)
MMGATICVLADAAAMPVQSFVSKFGDEFRARCNTEAQPADKSGEGEARA